jgi:hypothetical protein
LPAPLSQGLRELKGAPAQAVRPSRSCCYKSQLAVSSIDGPSAGSLMIPHYNDDGYLPPGIHPATLEETAARFGQDSEIRQAQTKSLRWLVDLARKAGVQRIVVNGSFVTEKLEPNDVDCVLLIGPDFPQDAVAEKELLAGLPFINMELVDEAAFEQFTERTFATDRNLVPKGMVEIIA